jgi:hypothetical protein
MSCKVKTFVGASADVLLIPISTGTDRLLLIEFLRLKSTFAWRLSNEIALLRQQPFVHRNRSKRMAQRFQPPEPPSIHKLLK